MTNKQTFIRAFPTEVERTGPRTLSGRLVPYGVVADVADLYDGKIDVYKEGFRRGAFEKQAGAIEPGIIRKIGLIHQHGPSGLGYLGPFVGLREEADGLYGEARIMPSLEADVEALLEAGVAQLSVEFRLPSASSTVVIDGVRWRTRAHLDQVALEAKGAYPGADVLAYRAEVEEQEREAAEAAAAAEAERVAAEEAAAAEAAERQRVEAAAEEAAERRRAWDEMTARLDRERMKQEQLIHEYGVTVPGGWKRD